MECEVTGEVIGAVQSSGARDSFLFFVLGLQRVLVILATFLKAK